MKKILVIEEDQKMIEILASRFEAVGYQALVASDVIGGSTMAVRHKPDLIVLDISLTGGQGLALAESLPNLPETRQTPVIFVTACKDPALRKKALSLHAADLFEKPYDVDELLAVIRFALGETVYFNAAQLRK